MARFSFLAKSKAHKYTLLKSNANVSSAKQTNLSHDFEIVSSQSKSSRLTHKIITSCTTILIFCTLAVVLTLTHDEYVDYASVVRPSLQNGAIENVTLENALLQTNDQILAAAVLSSPSVSVDDDSSTQNDDIGSADAGSLLGRDPNPPYETIVKADFASMYNPITDAGLPATWSLETELLNISYTWTAEYLNINKTSSEGLLGVSELGKPLHGRVTKNNQEFLIEALPGNSPFLFICTNSKQNIDTWKQYMTNWAPGGSVCHTDKCKDDLIATNLQAISEEQWSFFNAKAVRENMLYKVQSNLSDSEDRASLRPGSKDVADFCDELYTEMVRLSNGTLYPHMIKSSIPPAFLDFERSGTYWMYPQGKLKHVWGLNGQNPELLASYDDAFGYLREAKNVMGRQFGFGKIFHFRDHSELEDVGIRTDFGTGLPGHALQYIFQNSTITEDQLLASDACSNKVSSNNKNVPCYPLLHDSVDRRELTLHKSIFGMSSVSEILSRRGLSTAPSLAHQFAYPSEDNLSKDNQTEYERCLLCDGSSLSRRLGAKDLLDAKRMDEVLDNHEVPGRPVESWYDTSGVFDTQSVILPSPLLQEADQRGHLITMWSETLLDIASEVWALNFMYNATNKSFPSASDTFKMTKGGMGCAEHTFLFEKRTDFRKDILSVNECVQQCTEIGSACGYVEVQLSPKRKSSCRFYSTCTPIYKRFHNLITMADIA